MPSKPLTPSNARFLREASDLSVETRLINASVTPPVTPKITPAPVIVPNGISTASGSISLNTIPASFIIMISS